MLSPTGAARLRAITRTIAGVTLALLGAPNATLADEPFGLEERPANATCLAPADQGTPLAALLSETGCVNPDDPLEPAAAMIPFEPRARLWSDGATKRRWIALPDGATIDLDTDGDFLFPAGTVLMKDFALNGTPVETRLLVRHGDGLWTGYSYEWTEDLTDAVLLDGGKTKPIDEELSWTYPSRSQCVRCHTGAAAVSLGPEVAQLNGPLVYPATGIEANQLATLEHIGIFTGGLPAQPQDLPALVETSDDTRPLKIRARSYLHANCSDCHRPGGGAPAADFRYHLGIDEMDICSEVPVRGDMGIPGALLLYPGEPSLSLVPLRMRALDFYRMPPLGTHVVDESGAKLIEDWIATADVCESYPDTDLDGVTDDVDNCIADANADQHDDDADGIGDLCDNCMAAVNADQRDTDLDGYGNACDPDLDNSGAVNFVDLGMLKSVFFSTDDDADLNGDGAVNFIDLGIMKSMFFGPPGP